MSLQHIWNFFNFFEWIYYYSLGIMIRAIWEKISRVLVSPVEKRPDCSSARLRIGRIALIYLKWREEGELSSISSSRDKTNLKRSSHIYLRENLFLLIISLNRFSRTPSIRIFPLFYFFDCLDEDPVSNTQVKD